MIPGQTGGIPESGSGSLIRLKILCGACKDAKATTGLLHARDFIAQAQYLNQELHWRHFDSYGWCCPGCTVFLESVRAE